MKHEPRLEVKLGGKTVHVPVYKDEQTTLRIVEHVNQRLAEIEEASPRIDTQAFALQTAYLFALDVEHAHAEEAEDEADLIRALTRLQLSLKEVLNELSPPA